MSDIQVTNFGSTPVEPRLRYCRNQKCWCYNANLYGVCSITACINKPLITNAYGKKAKQIIVDAAMQSKSLSQKPQQIGKST